MIIDISAASNSISFFGARQLLHLLDFQPQTVDDNLTCHLLMPFHGYRDQIKDGSLTDTMDVGAQLRFFLSDRVQRRFSGFARRLVDNFEIEAVNIFNAGTLDAESRFFFDILRDVGNVTLSLHTDAREPLPINLDGPENHIERFFAKGDIVSILDVAEAYLSVGNHWSVQRLLNRLEPALEETSPQIARLRAVAHVLADRPIEAERFYERWKTLGDTSDLVKANYGLSMLYMRHHPKYLRNMVTAEALLNEAYDVSQTLSNEPFLSIFNRNGYALVLFRKGKIVEAKVLLEWAIAELSKLPGRVALMHKSVIMYNVAQCHFSQGSYEEALKILSELIAIDSGYPEYHMEIARNQIALACFDKALEALGAAHACDPSVAEIHNQAGFCHLQLGQNADAVSCYEKALRLQPSDPETLHALVYALSTQEQYQDVLDTLSRRSNEWLGGELGEQLSIVRAEALSFVKSAADACVFLETEYPEDIRSLDIKNAIISLQAHEYAN